MAEGGFVGRLGEEEYWQDNGRVGILDLLADAGLLAHDGLVLTRRAHESSCGLAAPCGTFGLPPGEEKMPGGWLQRYGRGTPRIR